MGIDELMLETADIAVIGGGAAGLAAAIFAAQFAVQPTRVVLIDGAKTLGAKILVSGGGRCNVTHDIVTPEDFNASRAIVRNVLAEFGVADVIQWFDSMGIALKREPTGKLFPVADSARVVLAALLRRCGELGVIIRTGCRVRGVAFSDADRSFLVAHDSGTMRCSRVIMSTGGRSLPRSGSDGSGWEIARQLGHTVTPTYAALVPLVLDKGMFHASLAGVSLTVELSTFATNKLIDRRTGSLLWTHFGISGPVVMDASRHWVIAHESAFPTTMQCNLLPPDGFETVERWLIALASSSARTSLLRGLAGRMPERVAAAIACHVGVDPAIPCGQLSRDARRTLVHALTALPLPIVGHRGWNYAEVTAGGVPLAEIDPRTMESRRLPGLYLAGEMLDCDGRIGGFNFQWAWSTGYLAGRAAGTACAVID